MRTGAIARALVKAGWRVTVVTIDKNLLLEVDGEQLDLEGAFGGDITILETGHSWRNLVPGIVKGLPNKGLNRLIGGICRHVASYFSLDREIGWGKHALEASSKFEQGQVDIVLSSGGPWISHQIAARISKRLKCPYILDYRDLWTGNPHTPVNWWWVRKKEMALYRGAAAIITITPSMQSVQTEVFGPRSNTLVVSNGYDPQEYANVLPESFHEFALVYTGSFIPPIRTVDPLFMVLRKLMDRGSAIPWRFHYYGPNESYVQAVAERLGVQDKVNLHGSCSRQEALSAVKGAGMAFVVTSIAKTATTAEAGILTGKVFEVIGLETPYLVVAPANADIRSVVETTGGGRAFRGDEVNAMTEYIQRVMSGNSVPLKNCPDYSWENLGEKLSTIIVNTSIQFTNKNIVSGIK